MAGAIEISVSSVLLKVLLMINLDVLNISPWVVLTYTVNCINLVFLCDSDAPNMRCLEWQHLCFLMLVLYLYVNFHGTSDCTLNEYCILHYWHLLYVCL